MYRYTLLPRSQTFILYFTYQYILKNGFCLFPREVFIDPTTNTTYTLGQYVKRLKLAETLEIIAKEGADAIYNGSLTEKLVADIRSYGGIITVNDLNTYT